MCEKPISRQNNILSTPTKTNGKQAKQIHEEGLSRTLIFRKASLFCNITSIIDYFITDNFFGRANLEVSLVDIFVYVSKIRLRLHGLISVSSFPKMCDFIQISQKNGISYEHVLDCAKQFLKTAMVSTHSSTLIGSSTIIIETIFIKV